MYRMETVASTLDAWGSSRAVAWMGAFGAASPKPLEFRGSAPFLSDLCRSKRQASKRLGTQKVRLYITQKRVSKKSSGWRKSGWTTGAKGRLKSPQVYPVDFVKLVASLVSSGLTAATRMGCTI
eukprot:9473302-Pyramimonas_sp.AAC.1